VGVSAATSAYQDAAQTLAERLEIPLLEETKDLRLPPDGALLLRVGEQGPELLPVQRKRGGPISLRFGDSRLRHRRRGGHNELLGRAVGWNARRSPSVLDATGGFGRDAFLLADLGCEVLICEREPVMNCLLEDAISDARGNDDPWLQDVASRLNLRITDSRRLDESDLATVDVIYLDPMFPVARRALPGKEMQMLHLLLDEGNAAIDDPLGEDLAAWALQQAVSRIVVKRPRRAQPLAVGKPDHVLTGRAVRFDVYLGRESVSEE